MSFLFGGGTQSKQPARIKTFRVQQSSYGTVVQVVYGRARIAPNILWSGDFKASAQTSSVGKGGGGSGGKTYTYTVSLIMGLSQGPITSIGRSWKVGNGNHRKTVAQTAAKWTEVLGAFGQAAWSFLTSNHPGEDIGYTGVSYVAQKNIALGSSASPPQYTFEVFGLKPYSASVKDANPKDIITDFISNSKYGTVPGATWLDPFATYSTYCVANSLFLSPVFDQQKAAGDWLKDLLEITNSDAYFSNGLLKISPMGDVQIGAYTPNLVPIYDFTDDDLIRPGSEQDPIVADRQFPTDRYNTIKVEYINAANDYNLDVVEAKDEAEINVFNKRIDAPKAYHPITSAAVAKFVAHIQLQRQLWVQNTYKFKVSGVYFLLDAMDIVGIHDQLLGLGSGWSTIASIGSDGGGPFVTFLTPIWNVPPAGASVYDRTANLRTTVGTAVSATTKLYLASTAGMSAGDLLSVNAYPVRINTIQEADNLELEIEAEDTGHRSTPIYRHQPSGGKPHTNPGRKPQSINAPIIFEPTHLLKTGVAHNGIALPRILIGASGQFGNLDWGAANIYYSEDGGTTYSFLGSTRNGGITGNLLASLPNVADPDTTSTLQVDLSESSGSLVSIAHSLADNGNNLAIIDSEIISFGDVAAGAGANQFNLTYIRRGLYGTKPALHAINARFLFLNSHDNLDPGVFEMPVYKLNKLVGKTLNFKLTAMNPQLDEEEDISTVTAYPYTILGKGATPASKPHDSINHKVVASSGSVHGTSYRQFSTAARTILSTDYLEYDQFVASDAPSANHFVDIRFTDNTLMGAAAPNDQNGYSANANGDPVTLALGTWYHRIISLSTFAGKITNSFMTAWDIPSTVNAGIYRGQIGNVAITDGSGNLLVNVFSSGALPTLPSPVVGGLETNVSGVIHTSAVIDDQNVNTEHMASGAATKTGTVTDATSQNLTPYGSLVQVGTLTVTVNATGDIVEITGAIKGTASNAQSGDQITSVLKRGSTVLDTTNMIITLSSTTTVGATFAGTFTFHDTGISGSETYTLSLKTVNGSANGTFAATKTFCKMRAVDLRAQ